MGVIISCAWLAGFIACGYVIVSALLNREHIYTKVWLGCVAGLIGGMWLPSLAAFAMRFTLAAQWVALVVMAIIAGAAYVITKPAHVSLSKTGNQHPKFNYMLIITIAFTLLMAYLQYTHNLRPTAGELHVGQSTYGDLSLHAGIATGLNGAAYPPNYTLLPGARLSYPFLVDALSGSLYQLGMPLNWSLTLPGILMSACVFYGFCMFALAITGSSMLAAICCVLLFLNGGLGFMYTLDGIAGHPEQWRTLLEGFYKAPCNLVEYNVRWSNLIVDMLLPQRTFLAGLCALMPAMWMLLLAGRKRGWYVALGILGGSLPMIHTHSFFALGLLSIGIFAYYLVLRDREMLINLTIYGAIAAILSLPQLIVWTFPQSSAEGFIRLWFNWVNADNGGLRDGYLWFWLKNLGILGIFLIPASCYAPKRYRPMIIGAWCIFAVAECVVFQPNVYDNNKLFYVWYALLIPFTVMFLRAVYMRLKGLPGVRVIFALGALVCVLAAGLSICREVVSDYTLYDAHEVAAAAWVNENTDMSDRFLTGTQHKNPVSTLTGRSIVCGTSSFLFFHGLDFTGAEAAAQDMMEHPADNLVLFAENYVRYVYVSAYERGEWDVDEGYFEAHFERKFASDDVVIYEVSA